MKYAQDVYIKNSFTTVQIGALQNIEYLDFILKAHDEGVLKTKAVIWPMQHVLKDIDARDPFSLRRNNIHIGPVKLFADGEFNLGTASSKFMRSVCQKCQLLNYDASQIATAIGGLAENHDIAIHANGDEAIRSVVELLKMYSPKHRRHLIVHATLFDPELISTDTAPSIRPTFLVSRLKYWDDETLDKTFGDEKVNVFPSNSLVRKGVPFSIHTDAPVSPVSSFDLLECATLRRSKSGEIVGEDQCIGIGDAITACTAYPAWQNRLENVGSIEIGKAFDICLYRIKNVLNAETFSAPSYVYINGELLYERVDTTA